MTLLREKSSQFATYSELVVIFKETKFKSGPSTSNTSAMKCHIVVRVLQTKKQSSYSSLFCIIGDAYVMGRTSKRQLDLPRHEKQLFPCWTERWHRGWNLSPHFSPSSNVWLTDTSEQSLLRIPSSWLQLLTSLQHMGCTIYGGSCRRCW